MSTTKLYRKLALERCKLYTAQLCAAAHLGREDHPVEPEAETFRNLIASLNRDLAMLESLAE